MDHKMDTLVTLVTDVKDRLVPLASLPAQLQAGFNRVSGEINSFRKMVLQVGMTGQTGQAMVNSCR
jgi:hypothetical protein